MRVIETVRTSQCPRCGKASTRCRCDLKKSIRQRTKCEFSYIFPKVAETEKRSSNEAPSPQSFQLVIQNPLQETTTDDDTLLAENNLICPRCIMKLKRGQESQEVDPIGNTVCQHCMLRAQIYKLKAEKRKSRLRSREDHYDTKHTTKEDKLEIIFMSKKYQSVLTESKPSCEEQDAVIKRTLKETELKLPGDQQKFQFSPTQLNILRPKSMPADLTKTQNMFQLDTNFLTYKEDSLQMKPTVDKNIGFETFIAEAKVSKTSAFSSTSTISNLRELQHRIQNRSDLTDICKADAVIQTAKEKLKKPTTVLRNDKLTASVSEEIMSYRFPFAPKKYTVHKRITSSELIRRTQEELLDKEEEKEQKEREKILDEEKRLMAHVSVGVNMKQKYTPAEKQEQKEKLEVQKEELSDQSKQKDPKKERDKVKNKPEIDEMSKKKHKEDDRVNQEKRQKEKSIPKRNRQEENVTSKQKKDEEAEKRKKKEEEEAEKRKKKEKEEAEKRKKKNEEEAEKKKKKEKEDTEKRKKKEQEEAEKMKKNEKEGTEGLKKKEKEGSQKSKKKEEEGSEKSKKKEKEEAEKRKNDEEVAAEKRKEDEDAAKKRKTEEEIAEKKRKVEELAEKNKIVEADAKKAKEDTEALKKQKAEEHGPSKEQEKLSNKKEEAEAAKKEKEAGSKKKKEGEEVRDKKDDKQKKDKQGEDGKPSREKRPLPSESELMIFKLIKEYKVKRAEERILLAEQNILADRQKLTEMAKKQQEADKKKVEEEQAHKTRQIEETFKKRTLENLLAISSANLEKFRDPKHGKAVKIKKPKMTEIIIGDVICQSKLPLPPDPLLQDLSEPLSPLLFKKKSIFSDVKLDAPPEDAPPEVKTVEEKHKDGKEALTSDNKDPNTGIFRYALSDRSFIDKGWTVLPVEEVVRKMNVYRMRPAQPEFDWFERNKNKRLMEYNTGEKLAVFDNDGRCRWYYKNGRLALEYYNSEELNSQHRFVVYSNGEPDERGRSRPYTVLATFSHLGTGVVFDHSGKIRLKYNQTEGILLDREIGPVTTWKWHSLNEPPVLRQVMMNSKLIHKDQTILQLGERDDHHIRKDDDLMIAIETENSLREMRKMQSLDFKPFQIKAKALKINENFSLKVLDQTTIYLIFREGSVNIKLNIGMILDHHEIVDTDTAALGVVSNCVERFPAASNSIAALQRSVEHARRFERNRTARERLLRPSLPKDSADRLIAGLSRPLKDPLRTLSPSQTPSKTNVDRCRYSRKPSCNLYYNSRLP